MISRLWVVARRISGIRKRLIIVVTTTIHDHMHAMHLHRGNQNVHDVVILFVYTTISFPQSISISFNWLKRVLIKSVKQGGEIAFSRIGQDHYDFFACILRFLCQLKGRGDCGSRRDAGEQSLT